MEIVKQFTRARYDWPTMTDGKVRRARPGKDFTCSATGFRMALHKHAERNKLRVLTTTGEDRRGVYVEFRFLKPQRRRNTTSRQASQ